MIISLSLRLELFDTSSVHPSPLSVHRLFIEAVNHHPHFYHYLFSVFLDEDGMELFLDVLHAFPDEPAIETKVIVVIIIVIIILHEGAGAPEQHRGGGVAAAQSAGGALYPGAQEPPPLQEHRGLILRRRNRVAPRQRPAGEVSEESSKAWTLLVSSSSEFCEL